VISSDGCTEGGGGIDLVIGSSWFVVGAVGTIVPHPGQTVRPVVVRLGNSNRRWQVGHSIVETISGPVVFGEV
jgi:hypothetical protein